MDEHLRKLILQARFRATEHHCQEHTLEIQLSRVEALPHDDELNDECDEDVESLYSNSDDDHVEQDEVYKEETPHREQQQLPALSFKKNLDLQALRKSPFKHLMTKQPSSKLLASHH